LQLSKALKLEAHKAFPEDHKSKVMSQEDFLNSNFLPNTLDLEELILPKALHHNINSKVQLVFN
jgi:hypothetical protein